MNVITEDDYNKIGRMFKYRRPKKPIGVYINLAKYFRIYPELIKEMLVNINDYGYYKDWFFILCISRNWTLTSFIYKLIMNQLDKDREMYTEKEKISTLVKWMPREKSYFDKKLGFVDKFTELYFNNIKDQDDIQTWLIEDKQESKFKGKDKDYIFGLRKKYRKFRTEYNKYLNTTEIYLCSKELDKIKFHKISNICLRNNINKFGCADETSNKLKTHLFTKYIKLNLYGFIKKIFSSKITPYELDILNRIWDTKYSFFRSSIFFIDEVKHHNILLDLSADVVNSSMLYVIIGIVACLIENDKKKEIYMNCYKPRKINIENLSMVEIIKKLVNNAGTFKKINTEGIDTPTICFTSKKIDNIVQSQNKNMHGHIIRYYSKEDNNNVAYLNCENIPVNYESRIIKLLDSKKTFKNDKHPQKTNKIIFTSAIGIGFLCIFYKCLLLLKN